MSSGNDSETDPYIATHFYYNFFLLFWFIYHCSYIPTFLSGALMGKEVKYKYTTCIYANDKIVRYSMDP